MLKEKESVAEALDLLLDRDLLGVLSSS